ncbi:MAG: hypothetical protein AAB408_02260 [Patescibacteria group bacterium]
MPESFGVYNPDIPLPKGVRGGGSLDVDIKTEIIDNLAEPTINRKALAERREKVKRTIIESGEAETVDIPTQIDIAPPEDEARTQGRLSPEDQRQIDELRKTWRIPEKK